MQDDPDNLTDDPQSTPDDDAKHQQAKSPSVTGEEDVSGDMPSESPDIDEELEKVGLSGDEEGVKPLGENTEINEEQ